MRQMVKKLAYVAVCCIASVQLSLAQPTALDTQIRNAFENGELKGLHAVVILHKGELIAQSYFEGEDERWGTPLGPRQHGPDTLHDLRSVTKSIVSLLYGIALDEGKVPSPDAPLKAQFAQYATLPNQADWADVTIKHALSMRMGVRWNENLPYTNPRNSEIAMERAKDRYAFVLSQPIETKPGAQWNYNGGAVALIARLVEDGVGMPIDEYARRKLFEPLDITNVEWVRSWDGVPSAASGLRMSALDLAKIGTMILNDGRVDSRQIVSSEWLKASFEPRETVPQGLRYGLLWWLSPVGTPPTWAAGLGNGGQRFSINKNLDLVFIIFAGNYNQPDAWMLAAKIANDYLVPALASSN